MSIRQAMALKIEVERIRREDPQEGLRAYAIYMQLLYPRNAAGWNDQAGWSRGMVSGG